MNGKIMAIGLLLLNATVWGQAREVFTVEDGYWSCQIEYIGRNELEDNYEMFSLNYRAAQLTREQVGYVNRMLNKYNVREGDTYYLTISYWSRLIVRNAPSISIMVLTEYTNNTGTYNYYALNMLSRR